MDADVTWTGKAVAEAAPAAGRLRLRLEGVTAEEAEHFEYFAASHRYLPFGPYLALGGAVVALYGEELRHLLSLWGRLLR
jgi:prepilin signal peptidase PulO-like enzyme (type II secretory pathway)